MRVGWVGVAVPGWGASSSELEAGGGGGGRLEPVNMDKASAGGSHSNAVEQVIDLLKDGVWADPRYRTPNFLLALGTSRIMTESPTLNERGFRALSYERF